MKTSIFALALCAISAAACGSDMAATKAASQLTQNGPVTCSIQSHFGGYLTATGGGGQTYDAIHADATQVRAWERFTLVDTGVGSPIRYGIKTAKGYYLTAVGGGGRTSDVIHTNATSIGAWETFILNSLGNDYYTIQTSDGHYLGHAGQNADILHSDATVPKSWETFRLHCGI